MSQPDTSRQSRDSLRISSVEPRGWEAVDGRIPEVGDSVYCTEGPAQVVRVLGRTSDGSRLLELRCDERPQPFFASSSNVLVRSASETAPGFLDPANAVGGS
jgi:hypothetical protein